MLRKLCGWHAKRRHVYVQAADWKRCDHGKGDEEESGSQMIRTVGSCVRASQPSSTLRIIPTRDVIKRKGKKLIIFLYINVVFLCYTIQVN